MLEDTAGSSLPFRLLAGVLLGIGFGVILLWGFPSRESSAPPIVPITELGVELAAAPAPVEGAPAPDFELENLSGERVRLADYRGQVILINFWATWCAPCRIEMPALQSRYESFAGQGLVVLGVDFDEPRELVVEFRDEFGLTFPLLLDPGATVQQLYRVRGYPSSYFVGRDGTIEIVHIGIMTEGQLDGYLREMGIGS